MDEVEKLINISKNLDKAIESLGKYSEVILKMDQRIKYLASELQRIDNKVDNNYKMLLDRK